MCNYREWKKECEARGQKFGTNSATETSWKAYDEYGAGCLKMLRGMFAFGLWDDGRGMLFLARDRLGVKPLYCCRSTGVFGFASEVRALLQAAIVPATISTTAIRSYLAFGAVS